MKNSQKHAVLSWEDGHLTMDAMVNYHEGKLSPGDMYKAERHLLHCELCADATEGISGKSGKSLSKPIHELKEMVKMRVSEEGERKRLPRKYLAIAASFLLLAGLTYTVILISEVQFAETHGSVAMDVQEKKTPYTEGKSRKKSTEASNISENKFQPENEGEGLAEDEVTSESSQKSEEEILSENEFSSTPPAETSADEESGGGITETPAIEKSAPTADAEESASEPDIDLAIAESPDESLAATGKEKSARISAGEAQKQAAPLSAMSVLQEDSDVIVPDRKAVPEGGLESYTLYLEENQRVTDSVDTISGVVTVGFSIDPDSTIKDLRIVESLATAYDSEALRLVREGPRWLPPIKSGRPYRTDVRVEVVFK